MTDAQDLPYVQVAAEQMARAEALEAEVERLREALIAARDTFKRFGYPVYADACDDALEGNDA